MATVQYTARSSLTLGHAAGSTQTLELELSDIARRRSVEKNAVRAVSGRFETLHHRSDTVWTLTLAPVTGEELERLEEFLDSTSRGDSFLLWLYGNDASPIRVRRTDKGRSHASFMRRGSKDSDMSQLSISVTEV